MNYLNLFNQNILYFYIDLYNKNNKNNKNNKKEIINNILIILKTKKTHFISIIKNKLLKYKKYILSENIDILKKINNLFVDNFDLEEIYNNLNKNDKNIIWTYLKIFIILCEKYYFTL